MKVKELKELLQNYPEDEEVFLMQERHDYVGHVDLIPVSECSFTKVVKDRGLTVLKYEPDEDDEILVVIALG